MPPAKIFIFLGFLQVKAEMVLGKLVQKDGNLATDMDGNLRTVR